MNAIQHRTSARIAILAFLFAMIVAGLGVVLLLPSPVHSQVQSFTLNWTAPGDDGSIGTATSYDLRWSLTKPDTTNASAMLGWWSGATKVPGVTSPSPSGTAETYTVVPSSPFQTGATYYFVIRAVDDAGNVGGYSNVASKFSPDLTPPRAIVDLR